MARADTIQHWARIIAAEMEPQSARIAELETQLSEAKGSLEEWRFHEGAWGTDAHSVRKHIKALEADNARLRAALEYERGEHAKYECNNAVKRITEALEGGK